MPKTIDNVQSIGQILKESQLLNSSVRCTNCGHRPKHRVEGQLKNWCERCINLYYNREKRLEYRENTELAIATYIEPLYADATLNDFEKNIIEKVGKINDRDLFLFGSVGTGKTHLLAALLRHYYFMGYNCTKINFDDFCVQVRSTMSPASKKTEWDYIEPLKEIDLLVIDDLGLRSKQETDFAYVTLFSILNKRQERMLPTFISSNKSIEQLGQTFDARIASRLSTAVVVEMTGRDRRKDGKD